MPATIEAAANISARNGHSCCLLCGRQNPRSLNLVFRAGEDGTVRGQFKGSPEFQGYDGILHGGVVASLLDSAMTHCLFHQGIQAVTGDLHVRFVRSVPCDVSLTIRSWVLFSHPPLHRLRAELILNEKLMAWAEAKFIQRRIVE